MTNSVVIVKITRMTRIESVLTDIDAVNAEDPASSLWAGSLHPQAWIEGRRAHHWALELTPGASEPLQLAARAHHMRRWEVARESFSRTRHGYHAWRSRLYDFHADALDGLMRAYGYAEEERAAATALLHKRGIKTDAEAQTYEDAVSLAFLEIRLASFAETVDESQLTNALRRTWRKMGPAGHEAALALDLEPRARHAIERALAG